MVEKCPRRVPAKGARSTQAHFSHNPAFWNDQLSEAEMEFQLCMNALTIFSLGTIVIMKCIFLAISFFKNCAHAPH